MRDATPATIDNIVGRFYTRLMVARVIIMFSIFAITALTVGGAAHAARMRMDHATHLGEMMHSSNIVHLGCEGAQHCGAVDAATCEFACAGFATFLTLPDADTGHLREPAHHAFSSGVSHVSRGADLRDRPPQFRLL